MVDIATWPMERIMRLPDSCFGSKRAVSIYLDAVWGSDRWAMAEMGGSDRVIVWDLWVYAWAPVRMAVIVQLKLGLKIPATIEESDQCDDVLASFGYSAGLRRTIEGWTPLILRWADLRKVIALQGRRLIVMVYPIRRKPWRVWCGVTISDIPKEVPAWAI